ncbi:uncharacterized protein LOC130613969 [Hydractinia symbiolongicarpus]|uniref:uncharacterized protein LOC130613969 n=1 Tax=Hydractinia symbiolongicarpus TaxID=13093 RepID=UPI00254C0C9A|nr:uncharacterized protein LOC130613969 [Hydractinia symbiolongicarpus]
MVNLDTGYATSCFGILKIIEFICLLIGWACLVDATKGRGWRGYRYRRSSRENFFLGVNIAAWVFVIIWFCLYFFMLCGHFSFNNKMLIFAIIHLIWFLLLLISGALLTDDVVTYCGGWNGCEVYEVAAAFGLISALIFLIDAIYHWKMSTSSATGTSGGGSGGRTVVTKTTVVKTTRTAK